MIRRRLFIVLGLVLVLAQGTWAQNATSSPSSRFGYGELNDNIPVAYRAMGGVSTGMRSNHYINPSQPASYTACDTTSFLFDVAVGVQWSNYRDALGEGNRVNGNLQYVTAAFPIYKQWIAFSAGVMPYSSMGYSFQSNDTKGGYPYSVTYAGQGGISQAYGGLSFNICNWFALGANVYYMFGQEANTTLLSFEETKATGTQMYKQMTVNSWRFRYGAQFFHTFADKHTIVLGATFENRAKLKSEYLQYELMTEDSVSKQDKGFELPMTYSVGVSYAFAERLTVAVDYSFQGWRDVNYFGVKGSLTDRYRLSVGAEYRHNPMGRNYAQRMYWRAGASVIRSYVGTNNRPDFTVSAGFGLPLRTTMSMVNVELEYQRRNSMANIVENCLMLTIDAAINENWFFKRRL